MTSCFYLFVSRGALLFIGGVTFVHVLGRTLFFVDSLILGFVLWNILYIRGCFHFHKGQNYFFKKVCFPDWINQWFTHWRSILYKVGLIIIIDICFTCVTLSIIGGFVDCLALLLNMNNQLINFNYKPKTHWFYQNLVGGNRRITPHQNKDLLQYFLEPWVYLVFGLAFLIVHSLTFYKGLGQN